MADAYKCSDCHMTFGTVGLLQKHKRKFCVGGSLGDPDNLLLRKGLYSADSPRQRPVSPDDRDYPSYNPNQEAQLRQLAEQHGRQMEYLQLKNRDLEKQREDIRRRLEQLGKRGPTQDNTADLLAELRAQEERNQRGLNELKRQLYEMGQKRVNVIEVEKPINYPQPQIIQQAPTPPPPPPPEKERKSYIYPVYYGNSMVAEITAMRQAYLQNGGNDPDVLAQLSQMQAEAQRIEDEMKNNANYDNRHREKKPDLSGKMQMIELENDRLHKELMLLQEQNFLNQNKRKSDREGKYSFRKGEGHSNHHGDRHYKLDKQIDSRYSKKLELSQHDRHAWHRSQVSEQDYSKTRKPTVFSDKFEQDYTNSRKQTIYSDKNPSNGTYPTDTKKPVVPPLDLSSITGKKPDPYVLPPMHPEYGLPRQPADDDKHYVTIGPTYTFTTYKNTGPKNNPKTQDYKSLKPGRSLPDISETYQQSPKKQYVGRSQSLYMPKNPRKSGSTKGSIRSELLSRNNADDLNLFPRKQQMVKGERGNDLVGVIRTKPGHSKVTVDYYKPKHNDMKYETVTIKSREELNPENNHVIHTTTYKEEKLNGGAV